MTEDLINTLEFWQQVASEYRPYEYKFAICTHSKTFCEAWKSEGLLYICKLRDEFLQTYKSNFLGAGRMSSFSLLFQSKEDFPVSDEEYVEEAIKIRRSFINYCIQKFTP